VKPFRRLTFDLWYLRRPPWDNGTVPPEVKDFIAKTSPGRALDLGCGSGTSSMALARAGWNVSGVDFSRIAIRIARRKAQTGKLKVNFLVGHAARLPASVFGIPYDLILDIGCFHGLSPRDKETYLQQLERLLTDNGTWLVYGFFPPGNTPLDLIAGESSKSLTLKIIKRQDGLEKMERPSAWFWVQKM
jgi:ubiquinone/menaquinone biosynthesis C-methylase UbiE